MPLIREIQDERKPNDYTACRIESECSKLKLRLPPSGINKWREQQTQIGFALIAPAIGKPNWELKLKWISNGSRKLDRPRGRRGGGVGKREGARGCWKRLESAVCSGCR